jgi:NAD(P)H-dependent FMN reductase
MAKIIGISGSLRKGSFNTGLLRAAAEFAPDGCTVEIASIKGIPLYDGDVEEAEGVPAAVTELKDLIADSDGLLLASPEYNNSIPGVMKNAIDWLSRPPTDIPRVFRDRPVGLIGATPGGYGTLLSQTAWLPVFKTLGMRPWFGRKLYVGNADKIFDEAGGLIDENIRKRLKAYMAGFTEFVSG